LEYLYPEYLPYAGSPFMKFKKFYERGRSKSLECRECKKRRSAAESVEPPGGVQQRV
jgi:hypothetical protein